MLTCNSINASNNATLPPPIFNAYNLPSLTSLIPNSENFLDSLKDALQTSSTYLVKSHDCRLAALSLKRITDAVLTQHDTLRESPDMDLQSFKEEVQDTWMQCLQVFWMARPLTHSHVLLVKKWMHGWEMMNYTLLQQLLPADLEHGTKNWLEFQQENREDDVGAKAIEKWLDIVQIASESGDESLISVLSEDTIESDDEVGFDLAQNLLGALQDGLRELLLVSTTENFLTSGSLTFESHRVATKLQFVRAMHQLGEADFQCLVPAFFGGVDAVGKEESDAYAKTSWEKSFGKFPGRSRPAPKPTLRAGEAGTVGYTVYEVQSFLSLLEVLQPGQVYLESDPIASYSDVPRDFLASKIKRIEICWIDECESDEALGHIDVLCFQ
jgi:hypothetical protein